MIGKIFSLPVRLANVPFRAFEKGMVKLCGENDTRPEDRILSKPLEALAEAFEELDEDSK